MQKLNESRFQLQEFSINVWHGTAEPGMTPEDLLKPGSWCSIAARIKPLDRITIAAPDNSWWAEYLVIDTEKMAARVKLIQRLDIEAAEGEASRSAEYEMKYTPAKKWAVLRKPDGDVMRDGFARKEEAQAYLAAHVKAEAA